MPHSSVLICEYSVLISGLEWLCSLGWIRVVGVKKREGLRCAVTEHHSEGGGGLDIYIHTASAVGGWQGGEGAIHRHTNPAQAPRELEVKIGPRPVLMKDPRRRRKRKKSTASAYIFRDSVSTYIINAHAAINPARTKFRSSGRTNDTILMGGQLKTQPETTAR